MEHRPELPAADQRRARRRELPLQLGRSGSGSRQILIVRGRVAASAVELIKKKPGPCGRASLLARSPSPFPPPIRAPRSISVAIFPTLAILLRSRSDDARRDVAATVAVCRACDLVWAQFSRISSISFLRKPVETRDCGNRGGSAANYRLYYLPIALCRSIFEMSRVLTRMLCGVA